VPQSVSADARKTREFAGLHRDSFSDLSLHPGTDSRVKPFCYGGNHDKRLGKLKEDCCWFDNLAEVSIHGQAIVLCHYDLRVWNRSNRGSWHLYGHSHGRLPEVPASLSIDVGVDTHDHVRLASEPLTFSSSSRQSRQGAMDDIRDSMAQSGDTNRRSGANNKKGLGDPVLGFPAARVAEGVPGPLPEKTTRTRHVPHLAILSVVFQPNCNR